MGVEIKGTSRQFKLLRKAGVPFKTVYGQALRYKEVMNNAIKEGKQQESNSGEHSGTDSVGQEA